jgi:predicted nucleic acid-binding protein
VAFLETNIIRYLTQGNSDQAARAYQLLQQLDHGTLTVTTPEAVFVEAVYVLSSKTLYNLPNRRSAPV